MYLSNCDLISFLGTFSILLNIALIFSLLFKISFFNLAALIKLFNTLSFKLWNLSLLFNNISIKLSLSLLSLSLLLLSLSIKLSLSILLLLLLSLSLKLSLLLSLTLSLSLLSLLLLLLFLLSSHLFLYYLSYDLFF